MSDSEAVLNVLQQYIDGTRDRDVDALAATFHPKAVMNGYLAGNLLTGGPEPFLQAIAEAPPSAADYSAEVASLAIDGDIASAEVREQALLGLDFVNHFHLLRDDSGWHIVAKLFQGLPRQ